MNKQNILLLFILACAGCLYFFDVYFNNYYLNYYLISKFNLITNIESLHKPYLISNINNSLDGTLNSKCSIYTIANETFIQYPRKLPLYLNKSINYTCLLNESKQIKFKILFWNRFFGSSLMQSMSKCPMNNCLLTEDKQQLNTSNVIIFHMRDTIKELPKYRSLDQLWLFFLLESPMHSKSFVNYNNLFNLTATYKSTSNFTSEYSKSFKYIVSDKQESIINESFLLEKSDFAAAIISNCNDKSHRLEYINKLRQFIQVKVYGRCGVPCALNENCKEIISKKTKFYLAFENSICKDYVTEKLFDILNYNIVPVVYGDGNYDDYLPSNAYINARHFKNAHELAIYLNYLNTNKTAYMEYFKWRERLKRKELEPDGFVYLCDLCIKLNLNLFQKSISSNAHWIQDFGTFWNRNLDCKF